MAAKMAAVLANKTPSNPYPLQRVIFVYMSWCLQLIITNVRYQLHHLITIYMYNNITSTDSIQMCVHNYV